MAHKAQFLTLVNNAKSQIQETDIQTVKTWQDNNEDFLLIDVREDREWIQGHLPNAIHMGKGVIERDIESQITDKNKKLALYCGGGYRSALAALNIQKMGYTNVYSVDGGIRAWHEAGFDIVTVD